MSEEVTLDEFVEGTGRDSVFGSLPSDWGASALDDSTLFTSTSSGLEQYSGTKTYVPTAGVEGGQIVDDDGEITYENRPSRANLEIEEGNVLFAKMKDSVKVIKASEEITDSFIFSTGFVRVSTNDSANSELLKQILLSNKFNQNKDSLAIGSTQPAIRLSDLSALTVPVPPIQEQRKIATVLHNVDQVIQKTESIIKKLETIRRGTEQDLLSRGILGHGSLRPEERTEYKSSWVGEVPKEWDVQPYAELISDSSVGIVVKPTQYYDKEGDVPILRSKDISRDGIVSGGFEYMTQESHEENPNSQLYAGDIITVRSGEPGLSCVVPPEFEGSNCADLLISTPGENLDPHYAAMWINSRAGRKQIDRFQAGLAQKHFNLGALRKLRVAVPPISEQRRIIERVSSITESIDAEKRYKKRLKRLKRGLMQDLLSGTVRTTDTNIQVPEEITQYG